MACSLSRFFFSVLAPFSITGSASRKKSEILIPGTDGTMGIHNSNRGLTAATDNVQLVVPLFGSSVL